MLYEGDSMNWIRRKILKWAYKIVNDYERREMLRVSNLVHKNSPTTLNRLRQKGGQKLVDECTHLLQSSHNENTISRLRHVCNENCKHVPIASTSVNISPGSSKPYPMTKREL
jgi:hypothetical protein